MMLGRLKPSWTRAGDNPYGWVDSEDGLFGPPELWSVRPLLDGWTPPVLLRNRRAPIVDAYCSPAGFFIFSSTARAVLSEVIRDAAEWLPVTLEGDNGFSLLHPLRAVPLTTRARFKVNEVSKNITAINAFDFDPADIKDVKVFYVANPPESAAGLAGLCSHDVVAHRTVAEAWLEAGLTGITFEQVVNSASSG